MARLLTPPAVARACRAVSAMSRKDEWEGLTCRAVEEHGADPRDFSFKGSPQALAAFAERLLEARGEVVADLYEWLLLTIGARQVGGRPDRVEPRARKRRPKDYPHRHRPRHEDRTFRYAKS